MSDQLVFEDLLQLMESDPFAPAAAGIGASLEQLLFQISDQLAFHNESQPGLPPPAAVDGDDRDESFISFQTSIRNECKALPKKSKPQSRSRIGFRTRSKVDVLEDGYRWRKYGKKPVKSSPNLRNYYRCSTVGCAVKKRVERDADDASCVITVYEGNHNHPPATAVCSFSTSSKSTMLRVPQPWEINRGLTP